MKNQVPDKPILTQSTLAVKATAALAEQIQKELEENKDDKDLKEILDETNSGDDRR